MLWFYDMFRRGFRQLLEAIVTKTPYFVGLQPVNGYFAHLGPILQRKMSYGPDGTTT